jgi:hypothetical protein
MFVTRANIATFSPVKPSSRKPTKETLVGILIDDMKAADLSPELFP